MGNRRISPELKECALNLWAKGWELKDITDTLLVSQASLYRWRAIFEEHNSVTKAPCAPLGPARTRLTRVVLTASHSVYTQAANPELYLDELVLWLALRHDISISVPALQQHLTEAGLTREILLNIALERDEVLLQQWRDMLAGDDFLADGSQFICVDETSKNEHMYARHHGRAYSGDQTELRDVFLHGDRYSLVAALSVDGYIAADVSGSKLDSNEFLEFVQEHVLPQMNPYPDTRSVLVLDNSRIRANKALAPLIQTAGCFILYLPAYSSDLNPVEESFIAVKAYLRQNGRALRRELDPTTALLEACGCVTPDNARSWFQDAGYVRIIQQS